MPLGVRCPSTVRRGAGDEVQVGATALPRALDV